MPHLLSLLLSLSLALTLPLSAAGETFYLHATEGSDTNPGTRDAPLRTFAHALKGLTPGSTLVLLPGQPPIHEVIAIHQQSGAPGEPITIEGNHNVITALKPIDPARWEQHAPGLFRSATFLPPRLIRPGQPEHNDSILRRFFFVINGHFNPMGRTSKGHRPPLPAVADLKPFEWTYLESENQFYLALPPDRTPADYRIEAPHFHNGLSTSGECHHWRIRNLHVRHVLNDGFNLHGSTRDFHLENISANDCGDDGMSAHGDCEIEVRNFIARRNSTGITHVNQSRTRHWEVTLEDNYARNLLLLGSGRHEFYHSTISAHGGGIRLVEPDKGPDKEPNGFTARFEHCTFLWPERPEEGYPTPPYEAHPGVTVELIHSNLGPL